MLFPFCPLLHDTLMLPVPPEVTADADPLAAPLQVMFTGVTVKLTLVGCVTFAVVC